VGHTGRERAHVAEMAGIIEARQRLDSQQSENELVLKVRPTYAIGRPVQLDSCRTRSRQEFAQLKSHNTVFKLIGPSLVPQDANEAKVNVEKRLEFIKNEMWVEGTGQKQRIG